MESSGRSSAMDNPSNSNSNIHTIVKAQVVFLLSTLTEDNYERNQHEIRTVSGPRCLLSQPILLNRVGVPNNGGSHTRSYFPSLIRPFFLFVTLRTNV